MKKIKFTIYRGIELHKFITENGNSYWAYLLNNQSVVKRSLSDAKNDILKNGTPSF